MNKLRDKIRQATDMRPAALGFAAGSRQRSPSLLLFARGDKRTLASAAQHLDGFLVSSAGDRPGESGDAAQGLVVADGRIPATSGFDFIQLDAEAPATTLLDEDLCYLMKAETSIPDSDLRALHNIPLEGLIVEAPADLTVRSQIALTRLSAFTGKPLFIELQDVPSARNLEVLREAGGVGIIVRAELGGDRLLELRKTIESLPPRRKPRRDEREAVAIVGQVAPASEEEPFEDD